MTQEMKFEETEKLNPFFSVWLSTRDTVRYVLDHKDLKYSITIAVIAGISSGINAGGEFSKMLGIPWWFVLIGMIVLGPLLNLIGLYIGSAIYTWVGTWFGGTGKYKQMLQAIGVVMIPNIWMTPYWILSAVFSYNKLFVLDIVSGLNPAAIVWFLVSSLITMTFSIWMIVIQSKAIGEVHQFSSWKGFATLIIPSIVLGIIFGIVIFIIVFFAVSHAPY